MGLFSNIMDGIHDVIDGIQDVGSYISDTAIDLIGNTTDFLRHEHKESIRTGGGIGGGYFYDDYGEDLIEDYMDWIKDTWY